MRADLLNPTPQDHMQKLRVVKLGVVKLRTCSVSSLSSGNYSGGESEALSDGNSVVSLLDKLRSPVPSELARK